MNPPPFFCVGNCSCNRMEEQTSKVSFLWYSDNLTPITVWKDRVTPSSTLSSAHKEPVKKKKKHSEDHIPLPSSWLLVERKNSWWYDNLSDRRPKPPFRKHFVDALADCGGFFLNSRLVKCSTELSIIRLPAEQGKSKGVKRWRVDTF